MRMRRLACTRSLSRRYGRAANCRLDAAWRSALPPPSAASACQPTPLHPAPPAPPSCQQNIRSLFKKYSVPQEFDFLSIDVDFGAAAAGCCFRARWVAAAAACSLSAQSALRPQPAPACCAPPDDYFIWEELCGGKQPYRPRAVAVEVRGLRGASVPPQATAHRCSSLPRLHLRPFCCGRHRRVPPLPLFTCPVQWPDPR